jgi:cytidine deaminase
LPTTCRIDDLSLSERELIAHALRARENAHAPYSRFSVGAALRAADGTVHLGCNVEISSYGLTECAERVALFAARATGAREFDALAVAGPDSSGRPTPPCGACRQVIWDLAGDISVYLASAAGEVQVWRAKELLPEPFGPAHLEEYS